MGSGLDCRMREFNRQLPTVSKSRRPNSNANHESSWRKWAGCCSRSMTNLFSSNVNEILNYHTDLYKQGLKYRTINNNRSVNLLFMNRYRETHS